MSLYGFDPLAKKYLTTILHADRSIRVGEINALEDTFDKGIFEWNECSAVVLLAQPARSALAVVLGQLKCQCPRARVLVVGNGPLRADSPFLLKTHGFLDHGSVESDLIPAIRTVVGGRIWLRCDDLRAIEEKNKSMGESSKQVQEFTHRQTSVLRLVCAGLSNKQIGFELDISERTVKFHLEKIFFRLGIHDRHLIAKAVGTEIEVRQN